MASVYKRKKSNAWWIKFVGPAGEIVRKSTGTSGDDARRTAQRLADTLETASKIHALGPQLADPAELARATELLRQFDLIPRDPAPNTPDAITITTAAEASPLVQHERKIKDRDDYARHRAALREFVEWFRARTGSERLRDLTRAHLLDYVEHLKTRTASWHTRRHTLLYILTACHQAPRYGLPDPAAGGKIDPRPRRKRPLETYTLSECLAIVRWYHDRGHPHWMLACGLMAFCGLSHPSEIYRLQCGDLTDDVIHVGARAAKNDYRDRHLPIPASLAELAHQLADGQPPDAPLIRTIRGNTSPSWRDSAVMLKQHFAAATGKALPPKHLRKSFATFCVQELHLPEWQVEAYMGRRNPNLSATTEREYTARPTPDRLRPLAATLDSHLRHTLGHTGARIIDIS